MLDYSLLLRSCVFLPLMPSFIFDQSDSDLGVVTNRIRRQGRWLFHLSFSVSLLRVSGLVCFENRAVARVSNIYYPTLTNQSH